MGDVRTKTIALTGQPQQYWLLRCCLFEVWWRKMCLSPSHEWEGLHVKTGGGTLAWIVQLLRYDSKHGPGWQGPINLIGGLKSLPQAGLCFCKLAQSKAAVLI